MSSGLLALLDDVAAIAKAAAASVDDVAVQAVQASSKAAGVVIDDAAVTPRYVIGLSPRREIPIVWNIAKGSIKNKLVFLLPSILLLGVVAPSLFKPLLALGGIYLCFEGFEKLYHSILGPFHKQAHHDDEPIESITPAELEKMRTAGAIRTDFILSAEIMVIAYNEVFDQPFFARMVILVAVALVITAAVYGFVGLILKVDDVGLHLNQDHRPSSVRWLGRGLIKAMPIVLKVIGFVGTLAMLWVGGQILIHAVPALHHWVESWIEYLGWSGIAAWCFEAVNGLVLGIVVGALVVGTLAAFKSKK